MTEISRAFSIRPYRDEDWTNLWPIIREIAATGETFVYDHDISEARARNIWLGQTGSAVMVAESADGEVIGTAKVEPNQAGPGSHVATASFMVGASYRGLGVGHALACHVLQWATAHKFRAMQFNAVVETNIPAVSLWQRLGISIVGTVPAAFDHPGHGFVGLHVMHKVTLAGDTEPDVSNAATSIEGNQR